MLIYKIWAPHFNGEYFYERQRNDTIEDWANKFNDDVKNKRKTNPFNQDKISGINGSFKLKLKALNNICKNNLGIKVRLVFVITKDNFNEISKYVY